MIIKIEAYENGAHANQSTTPIILPEGWAIVPEDMEIPDTFPFVNIEAEEQTRQREIGYSEEGEPILEDYTVMVVASMTAGVVPEPVPVPSEPTELEQLRADVDYIAMETGVEL